MCAVILLGNCYEEMSRGGDSFDERDARGRKLDPATGGRVPVHPMRVAGSENRGADREWEYKRDPPRTSRSDFLPPVVSAIDIRDNEACRTFM